MLTESLGCIQSGQQQSSPQSGAGGLKLKPRKKLLWLLKEMFFLEVEACGGQNILGQVYIQGKKTNTGVYIMDSCAEWADEETVVWGWCQALLLGKIWSGCMGSGVNTGENPPLTWKILLTTTQTETRTRTTLLIVDSLFVSSHSLVQFVFLIAFLCSHIWRAGLVSLPSPMHAHTQALTSCRSF